MARGEAVVAVRRILPRRLEIVPRRASMTVARVRAKVEKKGRRGVAAAQGAVTRGAAFARACIDRVSRFFGNYRGTTLGLTAIAAYVLFVLLV
jgi:hypothetical protein